MTTFNFTILFYFVFLFSRIKVITEFFEIRIIKKLSDAHARAELFGKKQEFSPFLQDAV